jgi:hypothetical protein
VSAAASPLLEWGAAGFALEGGVSGDRHVVTGYDGGVLVAAIDGLGHGVEAALAARRAAEVLEARASEPLPALVEGCHAALRGTRGACVTLAALDAWTGALTWLGVGNVEAALIRASGAPRASITLRGGVVGYRLPPLRPQAIPVAAGDTLLLATDGLRAGFADLPRPPGSAQQVAEELLARYGRRDDDALVVVATYLGGAPP